MRRGSIALRLFWISLLWLVAALAFTAYLLTGLYSRALDGNLQETLEFHLETLIGETTANGFETLAATGIGDPRFSRPASGWYWEIRDAQGDVLSFSPSLIGSALPEPTTGFDGNNLRTDIAADGFGTQIRMVERRIVVGETPYFITVTGNLDEIFELVANFRGQTLIVLGAVGAMLAIMSAVVARLALRPVGKLRDAVEDVRQGDRQIVEGTYPAEIAPLAYEINELLQSNTRIIERARSQVGNLAHALKTPIAVLNNEASAQQSQLSEIVRSEAQKMSGMVTLYLDRARLSARTAVVGRRSDAEATLARLCRVMNKLNPEMEVVFSAEPDQQYWFRGEESDLEEMAGNLLDNACKWAHGRVEASLRSVAEDGMRRLIIAIDDDGAGLSEADAERVLKRGVRLDEKAPGSGLGLDIVKELADVYGGRLELRRSELGGVSARLVLPAAGRERR